MENAMDKAIAADAFRRTGKMSKKAEVAAFLDFMYPEMSDSRKREIINDVEG